MIKLPDVEISQDVLNTLKEFQDEVDSILTFNEQKARAKELFESQNKDGNETFDSIKDALTDMCAGARRCVYCEDSLACEVEHIRPKSLYPENCFDWENYVYACGFCNKRKGSRFAVFDDENNGICRINQANIADKGKGNDVMINPRKENPMDYCILDLRNAACRFVVIETLSQKEKQKAKYTFFTLLNLNDLPKENIRQARENAYTNYKTRLSYYTSNKAHLSADRKEIIIQQLKQEQHPTVWKEMQRYYRENWLNDIDEELHSLFEASSEALDW